MTTSKSKIGIFATIAGSFASGLTIGLLFAPKAGKENRSWISKQTDNILDWMDKKREETVKSTEDKFSYVRKNIESGMRKSIPDLYSATEDLSLDEGELME